MAQVLATVRFGRVFADFRRSAEQLRDEIVTDGGAILKREEQASIRTRFYDTGATLRLLHEEITSDGDNRTYVLTPTATSKRGAPYPLFGEYGTGRRGAVTGRPAPRGYRYGDSTGMAARRFSRIAVSISKPQVDRMAEEKVRQLASAYSQ